MAKQRVTIGKSNGTTSYVDFNIPESPGTYKISATLENGTVLNAGNIVVDGNENTYYIKFDMSDGTSFLEVFSTPIIYRKVSYTVPTGVKWVRISLNKSPYTVFVDKATSAGTVNIPYGQEIFVQASPSTGYNNPNVNGSGTYYSVITPTSDTTINIVAGGKQTFTLSYPAKPAGVGSYTITRNGSTLVSNPTSAGTATIYYGDTLAISATAASGYNAPTYSLSATTVTGNVTATVTAGSLMPKWYTIGNSAGTYSNQIGVTNIRITAYAEAFAEEPIYDACGSDIIGYVTAHAYDSGTFTGLPCSGTLSDYDSNTEEVIYDDWNSTIVTAEAEAYGKVSGTYSNNVVKITATGDAEITKVEVYK